MDAGIKNNNDNFNTSHVNVNLSKANSTQLQVRYFNTSHVNVNPSGQESTVYRTIISIHLMLMLIHYRKHIYKPYNKFQYISC